MANFEFEFNQQDRELIVSQDSATFSDTNYIRLTIYPEEGVDNIVTLPNTDEQAIFYSSLNDELFDINISPFGIGLDELRLKTIGGGETINPDTGFPYNDFKIYKNVDGNIYIKPNEIFNDFELPQGDYRIQIDFLNQVAPSSGGEFHYKFIIKQVSTSRKEVRLKILDEPILNNSDTISELTSEFNQGLDKYQFKHVLNIGTGDHIPIMNYAFDKVTDGNDNQSIILKLYEPLPTNVGNLSMVTIEKEVLTTQIINTYYFSDVPDVYFGDGLLTDTSINWENQNNQNFEFESFDELSGSLDNVTFDSLISESQYNYPNLNTDFNEFANHTFFGSAKKKLQNFKTKVETIQSYYSEISSSLVVSSSITGDEDTVVQRRKDLFNLINEEIKTFTPYEKFLYYDAQSETTASAPGLINYADTEPVRVSPRNTIQLNQHNGFNVVYKHSSEKLAGNHNQFTHLFTDKYKVENKPFFNYSGSIYLSFLLQGDSGSSLTWENRNKLLNPPLPHDTLYQNNILNPDMTGSAHQRYVFQASMSYFVPNTDNNDMMDLSFDGGDYDVGSTKITILSGSVKTGSAQIKDTTGLYTTTAITQSGVPFFGSIMPTGELFTIFTKNNLSSSLQGYWNIDDVTSGSSLSLANVVNDAGPTTGDATDILGVTASAGVTSRGRTYGSSYFMISESGDNTGVHFDSTDFNFNKDDNFSLSVWVKRFHPNTGSADPTKPSSTNAQGIFVRGNAENSYGIEYRHANNQFRCGVRPGDGDTKRLASHTMTDDGLNWHHVVMTYESASATGIKLYVDGVLEASTTNVTDGDGVTMGDFSASNANVDVGEKLSLGGDDILAGSRGVFNGFLQYPRVYDRTITAEEVNQLYLNPTGVTETKITDVKLTLKDPSDVLPFDNLFYTGSTEWNDWYNGMLTKAEEFDTDNIHSFENNLPLYIQESSEYNDMKDFLNLQGEQYDLIRNHIDSMGTIHKRGYKKTNSPPDNTLPMLLSNMGWQAINPFSGSLTDTLGSYLSGITSIDDIKNNTWRKTLNNLLYIYKSKGTKNSVRALLNTYGYPPDVLQFQEFTNVQEQSEEAAAAMDYRIPASGDSVDTDFSNQTGSFFNYSNNISNFITYKFSAKEDRILNLDWWMDDANINNIELVYKHVNSNREQTILKNSGSGDENLWDLRLLPSSDGLSSSFEFRLNNSQVADTSIGSRNFTAATDYLTVSDGQLWNIMLQRMTGSTSGPGTIEYRLHAAFQEQDKITTYGYVTMSISGGLVGDSSDGGKGFFANQNFQSSGSRHALSSSNLFVGGNSPGGLSGSIAQIKAYSNAISQSKFTQHILDKFSVVGNTSTAHDDELIYHFKLNENYLSSSVSSSAQIMKIVDSSPSCNFNDYSLSKNGEFFTSSILYGSEIINVVRKTLNSNTTDNIFINPIDSIVGNLKHNASAIKIKQKQIKPSKRLEIFKSPQIFVNDFITQRVGGFNLEKLYLNPNNYYSQSYNELDDYRKEFFRCNPISVDTNKFIRAHENMFNESIGSALKQLVPGSSTFSGEGNNIGVEIKQTILERQKYENKKPTLETNPNTFTSSVVVNPVNNTELLFSKSGSIGISVTNVSTFEQPKSASIGVEVTNVSTFEQPKSASVSIVSSFSGTQLETAKSASINYSSETYKSFENLHKLWGRGNNSVHFVDFNDDSGSTNTYNTRHVETRYHFYAIGDTEYYSPKSGSNYLDHSSDNFDNSGRFNNRIFIKNGIHSNITYESLINGSPGNRTGRMIGKTRYFITSSNGEITLPRNHVTNFSNPFKDRMIDGTQNTDPGFLNVRYEDYSTASFYRVNVTGGENEIKVKGGTPSIDNDTGRIMYD